MLKLKVPDIHCMSCVQGIESALKKSDPTVRVKAEIPTKEIAVESMLSSEETKKIIEGAGFEVQEIAESERLMNNVKLIYFKGCPETERVREALLKAGILDFQMIPQDDLPKGHSYLKLSSPSLISGDELIYGIRTSGKISSCTLMRSIP